MAPEPEQLLTKHGLARFLLEGPDGPVRYDFGEGLVVQADWTEVTEARFRAWCSTEPDWNPPEPEELTEPEQSEAAASLRARQADAAETVGFRHLAEELRKPVAERLPECSSGAHSFSWRMGFEDCFYCGEPRKPEPGKVES